MDRRQPEIAKVEFAVPEGEPHQPRPGRGGAGGAGGRAQLRRPGLPDRPPPAHRRGHHPHLRACRERGLHHPLLQPSPLPGQALGAGRDRDPGFRGGSARPAPGRRRHGALARVRPEHRAGGMAHRGDAGEPAPGPGGRPPLRSPGRPGRLHPGAAGDRQDDGHRGGRQTASRRRSRGADPGHLPLQPGRRQRAGAAGRDPRDAGGAGGSGRAGPPGGRALPLRRRGRPAADGGQLLLRHLRDGGDLGDHRHELRRGHPRRGQQGTGRRGRCQRCAWARRSPWSATTSSCPRSRTTPSTASSRPIPSWRSWSTPLSSRWPGTAGFPPRPGAC